MSSTYRASAPTTASLSNSPVPAPESLSSSPGVHWSKGLPAGSESVHLDAIRGIAALVVVLTHLHDAVFPGAKDWTHFNLFMRVVLRIPTLGYQAVMVFFVLSGFLVGGSVFQTVWSGKFSWRSYMVARMVRLYIVLLPALLIGGALDWLGMHMSATRSAYAGHVGTLIDNVYTHFSFHVLVENACFLQELSLPWVGKGPIPEFGSNIALWSLSCEFWYYIAIPLLALLLSKRQRIPTRVACALGLFLWGFLVGKEVIQLSVFWLLGALVAVLPRLPGPRSWVRGLTTAGSLIMLGTSLKFVANIGSYPSNFLVASSAALLIWGLQHDSEERLPRPYVRLARRSAASSYSLYLFHTPMLVLLVAWLGLSDAVVNRERMFISAGLLICLLVYARITYEVFEKNTNRVRNLFKPFLLNSKSKPVLVRNR